MKIIFLLVCFLFASEECIVNLTRTDNIPEESLEGMPDPYFEGYIQALVDMHYAEYRVIVLVKDHEVYLANLPKNELFSKSIISFVKDVPGVKKVTKLNGLPAGEIKEREKYVNRPQVGGIWFPQTTELFLPLVANPRQAQYSIGYRFLDRVIGRNVIAVDLGDDFPIFRWLNVLWGGDLQIGIEAGIWAVFNLTPKGTHIVWSTELVNTDYYVGFPLTYALNKWSWRLRAYHISSHLGDEYISNHPSVVRKNPSFEAVDLFLSYQFNDVFRIYFGAGGIPHSDKTFSMKYAYGQYGAEARFCGTKFRYHKLYGTWLAAAHLQNWQCLNWNFDGTGIFGYEWSKMQGIGRKMRIFAEYHNGYSLEGQFFKKRTSYGSIRLSYGF